MELHHLSKKWKDPRSAERSPEHTKVWTEPHSTNNKPRKVAVVYYLSRNGNLEHPHFIEVPLSSSDGLYLRDVTDRLNSLRGKGMAALYSWSSKRSYKNGFVWHDLSENDFIYPAHGQEYVLKGSELVAGGAASVPSATTSKNALSPDSEKSCEDDFPIVRRRRNQSWSAIDLHEYKVYTSGESARKLAADVSTQTDSGVNKRRGQREIIKEEDEEEISELSPPPSDSSPETLESLMKADGKLILRPEIDHDHNKPNPTVGNKVKTSSVLMQLISCGSISFRDCGPGAYGKDNPGFSLISHYKSRMLPRGNGLRTNGEDHATVEDAVVLRKNRRVKKQIVTEDKEYFSGSLIETKKEVVPVIKRSNSYNGNR
ncbi:upstream of flc-like protein [Tanacetum coccineum]